MKKLIAPIIILFTFFIFGIGKSNAQTLQITKIEDAWAECDELVIIVKNTEGAYYEKLKEVVEKNWRFSTPLNIVTRKELNQYPRKRNVLILKYDYNFKPGYRKVYELRVLPKKSVATTLVTIYLNGELNKVNLTYSINALKHIFKSSNKYYDKTKFFHATNAAETTAKIYGNILKAKTLLINEDLIKSEKFNDDISTYYDYDVKVVSKEEIEEAILKKDREHLVLYRGVVVGESSTNNDFVKKQPGTDNRRRMDVAFHWYVYQPNDGALVAYSFGGSPEFITPRVLENVMDSIEPKKKRKKKKKNRN